MCAERIKIPPPDLSQGSPAILRENPTPHPPLTRHLGTIPMPSAGKFPPPPKRQNAPGTGGSPGEFVPRSRHRSVLDSLYEAVLVTDYSGEIIEVNARAEQMTQVSQLDLVKQPISVIVPTLSDEIITRAVEHLKSSSHAVMGGWCLQADGGRVRVEIAVGRIDSPNRTELVFSLRNNTRQYAAKLQQLSDRAMLHHVACGIAMIDLASRIQYANKTFVHAWRLDDQESVVGKKAQEIWPEDVVAHLVESMTTATPWSGEVAVAQPDGHTLSFLANSVPYQNKDGVTEGVVVSFIDITALKSAEATIRREKERQTETARHEGNFAGSLNMLTIPDLIQLITSSNKTGTLEVMDDLDHEVAFASFEDGRIVCATCGGDTGEAAVAPMLEHGGKSYRFLQDAIRYRDPTVTANTMTLLLDTLRAIEEKKKAKKP